MRRDGEARVAWVFDGRRLALVEAARDVSLWDAVTGSILGRVAAGFGTNSSGLLFLPGGDRVIAVVHDERFTPGPFNLVF
jgi:hypothetical protein